MSKKNKARRKDPELERKVLQDQATGMSRQAIADKHGQPLTRIHKILRRNKAVVSPEQRLINRTEAVRLKMDDPPGIVEAIGNAFFDDGISRSQIATQLGVPLRKVLSTLEWYRKSGKERNRAFTEQNRPRKYSEEQIDTAIKLRLKGGSLGDISKTTGVDQGSLRHHFGLSGVILSSEQRSSILRVHPQEIDDRIVALSLEGKTRKEIVADVGVPESYTKIVRRRYEVEIDPEIKQKNAQIAKLAKLGYNNWHDRLNDVIVGKNGVLLGQYVDSKTEVEIKCEVGHTWSATPNHLISLDTWCPYCVTTVSKWQREVYDYVLPFCPDAELENTKRIGKELDVYVPSLDVGIECDGLFYHSAFSSSYTPGAAMRKAILAHEAGVKFLMLYEDEWANNQELVKAMIRWRLGEFNGSYLSARDLELRKMEENREFEGFFERNHIDGHRLAAFAWGLFYGGKLVCCASFGTNFRGEQELFRLATDYDYSVRGGAGKLLSQVNGPLVSYSNNRLSNGGIYRDLGFIEITRHRKPSYYYTDFKKRVIRYSCMKKHGEGLGHMTEEEQGFNGVFADKFGHSRRTFKIEDCGHKKWLRK